MKFIAVVKILVFGFGGPEFIQRRDFGGDRGGKIFLRRRFGLRGGFRLRIIGGQNNGAVLRPRIRALPVWRSRVVRAPKQIQYFGVRNFRRIKFHADDFGVSGIAAANIFVRGRGSIPPGVAAGDGQNARPPLKNGFHAPKTPAPQNRKFIFHPRIITQNRKPPQISRAPQKGFLWYINRDGRRKFFAPPKKRRGMRGEKNVFWTGGIKLWRGGGCLNLSNILEMFLRRRIFWRFVWGRRAD